MCGGGWVGGRCVVVDGNGWLRAWRPVADARLADLPPFHPPTHPLTHLPKRSRLWEELADVAHDNQDCFNYAAQLPLRMLLPLYTFVGLLCAEAFQSAADVHPLLEDVGVAERSCARLPPAAAPGDSPTLVLLPSAVTDFVAAAAEAQAAVLPGDSAVRKGAGGRPLALPGSIEAGASGAVPAASSDPAALLADYAAGVTEAQRAMQRLQAGGAGVPYALGGGVLGFAAPSGPAGSAADLAERSRLCQQLHRLLYAEAVLGQLFQRCEDISDGLEATGQVLRFMAKGLDEVRVYDGVGVAVAG